MQLQVGPLSTRVCDGRRAGWVVPRDLLEVPFVTGLAPPSSCPVCSTLFPRRSCSLPLLGVMGTSRVHRNNACREASRTEVETKSSDGDPPKSLFCLGCFKRNVCSDALHRAASGASYSHRSLCNSLRCSSFECPLRPRALGRGCWRALRGSWIGCRGLGGPLDNSIGPCSGIQMVV